MPPEVRNERIEMVPVSKLTAHPANPRQGDVGAIMESIRVNGFIGALVAQLDTGYVLAGNHTLQAARNLDIHDVPVIWVDLTDDAAERFLLAHNRTSDLATYDNAALADLLKGIADTDAGFDGTGYDGDALDLIITDLSSPLDLGGASEPDTTGDTADTPEPAAAPESEPEPEGMETIRFRVTTSEAQEIRAGVADLIETGTFDTNGAALRYCVSRGLYQQGMGTGQ